MKSAQRVVVCLTAALLLPVSLISCSSAEPQMRETLDDQFMKGISIAGFSRTNSYRERDSLMAIYIGPAETDLLKAIASQDFIVTPLEEKHHIDPAFALFAYAESHSVRGACSLYAYRSTSEVRSRREWNSSQEWNLTSGQTDALRDGSLMLVKLSLGCQSQSKVS